ncbi:MAG: PEP-CTERM sorting domain-containing protein [Desulfomonilia bacterium]
MKKVMVLIGLFVLLMPFTSSANLISDPGFEEFTYRSGTIPSDFGFWQGDYSTILGCQNEVTPYNSKMLSFSYTNPEGFANEWSLGEVWQLIDLSILGYYADSDYFEVDASALFNRSSDSVNSIFGISIYALSGNPEDTISQIVDNTYLTHQYQLIATDNDTDTWEEAHVSFVLPSGTEYLALRVLAKEYPYNETSYGNLEFEGLYADNVYLNILDPEGNALFQREQNQVAPVPEPSTMLLIGIGMIGLAGLRKRFTRT